ncbi:hypothetical protein [Rhodoligotrophos ferricapiens]|uniref:hypothetical protein n=1 Tax=Rhodoligotrophos ferricapiens TaxID=3069264 RepID=UPI00315CB005
MKRLFINIYRTNAGTEFASGASSRRAADADAEIEERRTPGVRRVACIEVLYRDGDGLEEGSHKLYADQYRAMVQAGSIKLEKAG